MRYYWLLILFHIILYSEDVAVLHRLIAYILILLFQNLCLFLGTENATFSEVTSSHSPPVFSITQALKTIKINVVFECTIYDASFSGVMIPAEPMMDPTASPSGVPDIPPR